MRTLTGAVVHAISHASVVRHLDLVRWYLKALLLCLMALSGLAAPNAAAQIDTPDIDLTIPTIIGVIDPAVNPALLLPPYRFADPALYEAETRANGLPIGNATGGFSGSGYVELTEGDEITFSVNVPVGQRGIQQLEIRYALPTDITATDIQFFRNGSRVTPSITVTYGGIGNWSTAAQITNLREGENTIKVTIPGPVSSRKVMLLDSLRVSQTPPDANRFLEFPKRVNSKFFTGNEANSNAYYRTIDPSSKRVTFDGFLTENGIPTWTDNAGRQSVINLLKADPDAGHAVYQNVADLNFGRDMYVKKRADGSVVSFVQNYPTVQDAIDGVNLLATVAMEYRAPQGDPTANKFTVFYVYDSNGQRINKIDLDGRGEKFVPALCNSCHGGKPRDHRVGPPLFSLDGTLIPGTPVYQDKGYTDAKWIPWDLDNLIFPASNTQSSQALQLRKLNRLTLCTNPTSAVFGMVRGWYGANAATCDSFNPTTAFDGDYVPIGWNQEEDHATLYRQVVAPSCRTCHAQRASVSLVSATKERSLDFTSFDNFKQYKNVIETLVFDEGSMPAAKVTFDRFWRSSQPAVLDDVLFDGKAYQNPPPDKYFPRGGLGPQRIPGHPVPKLASVNGKLRYRPGEIITLNSLGSLFNKKVGIGSSTYNNPSWEVKQDGNYTSLGGGRIKSIKPSNISHDIRGDGILDTTSNIRVGVRNRLTVPWAYLDYGQLYRDPTKAQVVFTDDDPATIDVWDLLNKSRDNSTYDFQVNCLFCHAADYGAGHARTIFHLEDPAFASIGVVDDVNLADKRFAYSQVISRIDCRDPQESLILIKPGDARRHFGGRFNGLGDSEEDYKLILEWIIDGAPYDAARSYSVPGAICNDDTDGDGLLDYDDNCPTIANASGADNQLDFDRDGIGDACELDRDGDGVKDDRDNCRYDANADQNDIDLDGVGDACDAPHVGLTDLVVDEDVDTAVATLQLSFPTPITASVKFQTTDGTAVSGQDYLALTQEIVFAPGEDKFLVAIPIIDDDSVELDEQFSISLIDENALVVTQRDAKVSIIDNDDDGGSTDTPRIVTTPDRSDMPDYGWVVFDDGTKQWINPECRSDLDAQGLDTTLESWSQISTYPDRPAIPCSDIGPGNPTPTPRVVTTPDRSVMPDYGWAVFPDGKKQWINADCRAQLNTQGLTTTLETWDQISGYPDRPAIACDDIATEKPADLSIVTTSDRQADGEYGWVVFPDNTKQWIPGTCRDQLTAAGIEVTIKDWFEISRVPDNATYRNCDQL